MQYTLPTVSALAATLSLVSAAPMPSAHASQEVIIVRQLAGFDSASTITAKLDATTVNNGPGSSVKSAALSTLGPWCAGFTDAQAKVPAKALNGDGIFNSVNEVVYAPEGSAIPIGSWWCGATRPEVENFVKNALANGQQGGDDTVTIQPVPAPINNGGSSELSPTTITVEIQDDTAGTTFFQTELPANVGVQPASAGRGIGRNAKLTVVGDNGDCDFLDAAGQVIDFGTGNEIKTTAFFVCEALPLA